MNEPAVAKGWLNPQRLRRIVQWGVLALCLALGVQFGLFVRHFTSFGQTPLYSRPPGVEGFLPIGARVGANLAKAYSDRRRFADAERVAREAVTLNPRYATARYNLGVALYYQDRYGEALEAFTGALRLKSDYGDALYAAATCAIELGDFAEAERLSGRMLRLDPARGARLQQTLAVRGRAGRTGVVQ